MTLSSEKTRLGQYQATAFRKKRLTGTTNTPMAT